MRGDRVLGVRDALVFPPGWLCGVDEAGRGPLAGPVTAAAVILDPARPIAGLKDSKQLSEAARDRLAAQIRTQAKAWAVASASVEEIDALNILQATLLAMRRAILALQVADCCVAVDGNHCPEVDYPTVGVIKGDARVAAISAASILAKTERDATMGKLDQEYPQYQFKRHKGYPTPLHLELLRVHGASPCHRRSFGPVSRLP